MAGWGRVFFVITSESKPARHDTMVTQPRVGRG